MSPGLPRWLGYGGLLPFLGLALAGLGDFWGLRNWSHQVLLVYAALILAFLGGISWGLALASGRQRLFSFSMTPFFAAFAAFLVPYTVGLWILVAAFLIAFLIDRAFGRTLELPAWYLTMRLILTVVVIACLLTTLIVR